MASWVLSAFRDHSTLLMLTLYKSMVRSRLEYCCPLWNPVKIGDIQKLENIQCSFLRRIAGCGQLDYWDRINKLRIMSLQRRRERYCIIQVWKILNGHAPRQGVKAKQTNKQTNKHLLVYRATMIADEPLPLQQWKTTRYLRGGKLVNCPANCWTKWKVDPEINISGVGWWVGENMPSSSPYQYQ